MSYIVSIVDDINGSSTELFLNLVQAGVDVSVFHITWASHSTSVYPVPVPLFFPEFDK